jgi:hypothetical protein
MNLEKIAKKRKFSNAEDYKRFYTQLDMAILKKDQAIINSKVKRGEMSKKHNNIYVCGCGCGREGCFLHC